MSETSKLPAISAPMPWQSSIWQQLHRQLAREELPHALLLHGTAHTGKSRLAMALARLLLCSEPADGHNCGHCHACEMSRAGSHGDFRWLAPIEKSKVIKIDQIREVVNFGTMTAGFGARKVIVFSPAESMNISAANALLKSLEEPTAGTYLLLVCHRPHNLPATLRSRCQQLSFPLPGADQSLEWLNGLTGRPADSAKLLDLAGGRPLLAEKIYHSADMEAMAAIPEALALLKEGQGSSAQLLQLLGQLPLEDALSQVAAYLQNAIRRSSGVKEQRLETRRYFTLLDEANRLAAVAQSGANPNPQLVLQSLLAQFQKALA